MSSVPGTAVAAIDHGKAGTVPGEGLDLLEGVGQRVAVIGIAGHGAHANHETSLECDGDADLGSEPVADAALPLAMQSTCGSCRA